MRLVAAAVVSVVLGVVALQAQTGPSILFVGNSFTFGAGSAVKFYRAETVTDLNSEGIGGVPALFVFEGGYATDEVGDNTVAVLVGYERG